MHREYDNQPNQKKNGQIGGEGSVAMLKKSKQLGCIFQDVEPPEFNSISRKGPKSLGPKRSVQFSKKKKKRPVKIREISRPSEKP